LSSENSASILFRSRFEQAYAGVCANSWAVCRAGSCQWTKIRLNVKGLLFSVQKALPSFRDGGSIILNASTSASKGMPAASVYAATKAAVRSFARSWTTDLKDRKIRVNAVSPGVLVTPGFPRTLTKSVRAFEARRKLAG
jgi:NAD(P)-dependent dehydrogenase (short-subunit alcohol dehydrogenase family)